MIIMIIISMAVVMIRCTDLEPVDHPTNAMISGNNVQAEIDLSMLAMMQVCR